jgi:hypothetical protein
VFKNIMQSGFVKAGSSFRKSAKQDYRIPTLYDVYSVYQTEKHYQWCLGNVQKKLENIALMRPQIGREKPKTLQYQGITSYDVFADCQANLHHRSDSETRVEKLGVAFGFGASILIVCLSVFLFS